MIFSNDLLNKLIIVDTWLDIPVCSRKQITNHYLVVSSAVGINRSLEKSLHEYEYFSCDSVSGKPSS